MPISATEIVPATQQAYSVTDSDPQADAEQH
jgi:hypothetical protein